MAKKIRLENYKFAESPKRLRNPNRGFYNLYRFMITDEKEDYGRLVQELLQNDEDTTLSLIEINLCNYCNGSISIEGVNNIKNLCRALDDFDKRLIFRFLYDWDGKNMQYEPKKIDIILGHMEQLKDILKGAGRQIFVLQGLFIGNWGEMNGTRYSDDGSLQRLAEKLESVTEGRFFLAVRTPLQWRRITGLQKISEGTFAASPLARRLSLYNDGMLGNESDYGTYVKTDEGGKRSGREAELEFQQQLCSRVPNGGEVIHDNRFNDFENAVKDLAAMHVTYLNQGYDRAVLDKWKKAQVTEKGCYHGMDGYTYIERHLGYRFLIESADFRYNRFMSRVRVKVIIRNVGFAPLYAKARAEVVLHGKEQDGVLLYELKGDLRELPGGKDMPKTMTFKAEVSLKDMPCAEYGIYFSLTCPDNEERILLANEQEIEEYGYLIGTISMTEGD